MWRGLLVAIGLLALTGGGAAEAALPPAGGTILVADLAANADGRGALVAVNPRTGSQRTIASGAPFLDPEGLAVRRRWAWEATS
jgi:hypothetical protein